MVALAHVEAPRIVDDRRVRGNRSSRSARPRAGRSSVCSSGTPFWWRLATYRKARP